MKKIRVLHLIKDEKFFDRLIVPFDADDRLENQYLLIKKQKESIKRIHSVEKVISKNYLQTMFFLRRGNYDVVYFHSISESHWRLIQWIPKSKVIIWWSWGFDLYASRIYSYQPLIRLNLYKPLTSRYLEEVKKDSSCLITALEWMKARYFSFFRDRYLKRIDYYYPVVEEEYTLLKKYYPDFNAHLFFNPTKPTKEVRPFSYNRVDDGLVLLGNSSHTTNNHLDIIDTLEKKGVKGKNIIIPVSYGDMTYKNYIKERICSNNNNITLLEDFLPLDEYCSLMDSCKYAIFGVVRQQAMDNIYFCIQKGIKLFFYEDSVMYHFLIKEGFIIYTIEGITPNDLQHPLSLEQAEQNYETLVNFRKRRMNIYNEDIQMLQNRLLID